MTAPCPSCCTLTDDLAAHEKVCPGSQRVTRAEFDALTEAVAEIDARSLDSQQRLDGLPGVYVRFDTFNGWAKGVLARLAAMEKASDGNDLPRYEPHTVIDPRDCAATEQDVLDARRSERERIVAELRREADSWDARGLDEFARAYRATAERLSRRDTNTSNRGLAGSTARPGSTGTAVEAVGLPRTGGGGLETRDGGSSGPALNTSTGDGGHGGVFPESPGSEGTMRPAVSSFQARWDAGLRRAWQMCAGSIQETRDVIALRAYAAALESRARELAEERDRLLKINDGLARDSKLVLEADRELAKRERASLRSQLDAAKAENAHAANCTALAQRRWEEAHAETAALRARVQELEAAKAEHERVCNAFPVFVNEMPNADALTAPAGGEAITVGAADAVQPARTETPAQSGSPLPSEAAPTSSDPRPSVPERPMGLDDPWTADHFAADAEAPDPYEIENARLAEGQRVYVLALERLVTWFQWNYVSREVAIKACALAQSYDRRWLAQDGYCTLPTPHQALSAAVEEERERRGSETNK